MQELGWGVVIWVEGILGVWKPVVSTTSTRSIMDALEMIDIDITRFS